MSQKISRKSFLQKGSIAALGLTVIPGTVLGKSFGYTAPSNKLNIAGIVLLTLYYLSHFPSIGSFT